MRYFPEGNGKAIAGTWVAFEVALVLALPQPPAPMSLALGAVLGGAFIVLGFSAASQFRPTSDRRPSDRLRVGALSIIFGAVLGGILLSAMVAAVRIEPALRSRFAGRLHEAPWRPWALAFESSILEETVFRLFALSVTCWLVVRISGRAREAYGTALVASSLLFGAAHLPAWLAIAHGTALLILSVLALNALGGLLFGWVFWRWGLPYAIMAHFAGDVVIQTFAPRLIA